ncbi:unnamed protein product [Schistosoma spindalis]|nr:unnamed protein product [Schistosoma spindale]
MEISVTDDGIYKITLSIKSNICKDPNEKTCKHVTVGLVTVQYVLIRIEIAQVLKTNPTPGTNQMEIAIPLSLWLKQVWLQNNISTNRTILPNPWKMITQNERS